MTEAGTNTPLDRFIARAISLFRVLAFYLWQPIRRPIWFYETRIEVDHKDTQTFLIEIAGVVGFIFALGFSFTCDQAQKDLAAFFGYNIIDVGIVEELFAFVVGFVSFAFLSSIVATLEIAGLMLVGPKNIGIKNYLYYRTISVMSALFLAVCFFAFIALIGIIWTSILGLPGQELSDQIPVLKVITYGVSLLLLFAPTYIVLLRKMGSWWRPLFLFLGWFVYGNIMINRLAF